MELTKHEFIDEYPYLVYTNEQTVVYSDKADTSIDDIGGGGGATFGNLQFPPSFYTGTIAANETLTSEYSIEYNLFGVGVDGDVIVKTTDGYFPFAPALASGLNVIVAFNYGESLPTIGNAYDVTLAEDEAHGMKFATVEGINVTITQTTVDWESDEPVNAYVYTVPELEDGHCLFISATVE